LSAVIAGAAEADLLFGDADLFHFISSFSGSAHELIAQKI
jgi:hypothetical protein